MELVAAFVSIHSTNRIALVLACHHHHHHLLPFCSSLIFLLVMTVDRKISHDGNERS